MNFDLVADTPFRRRMIATILAGIVREHIEIGHLDPEVLQDKRLAPLAMARVSNVPAGQAFIDAYQALSKLRRIEEKRRATSEARRGPERETP